MSPVLGWEARASKPGSVYLFLLPPLIPPKHGPGTVVQLVKHWPRRSHLHGHISGVTAQAGILGRREETAGPGVYGHPQLHRELRASLGYTTPYFQEGGQEPLCYDSRLSYPGPAAPSNTPETKC